MLNTRRFNQMILLFMLSFLTLRLPSQAQDGLNLPTELYILLNEGRIERYGVGAAGVQSISTDETFILDFAVAPDNNWLAYRTEEGLFLKLIPGESEARLLEGTSADFPPVRGRGDTIDWSPDGSALAYTTEYGVRVAFNTGDTASFTDVVIEPLHHLSWSPQGTFLSAEAANDIWWIFRREGIQMNLVAAVPGARGTDWLSDTWLIFAPLEGGLRLMDLGTANQQTVLQDDSQFYFLPVVTPDGSIAVFSRNVDDQEIPEGSAYWTLLEIEGADVFVSQQSEVAIDLTGVRWAPQGQLAITLQNGTLALLLAQTGQVVPLPIGDAVAYGWGAPRPNMSPGVTMSSDGYFLAPDLAGVMQVWRLPGNGIAPIMITAAAADIIQYELPRTPAGDLIFVSNGHVWRQPLSGSDAEAMLTLPENAGRVSFNRSGNTIAYAVSDAGIESPGGIWFASTTPDVDPQRVLPNSGQTTTYTNPNFSPESDAMLANLTVNESISTVMLDPESGDVVMLGNFGSARWTDDGQVLAYGGQERGALYLINPDNRPINASLLLRTGGRIRDFMRMTAEVLRVVVSEDNPLGPTAISLLDVRIGEGEPDDVARPGFITDPVISPDGQYVAGVTGIGGSPLVYDVNADRAVVIENINGAQSFRWAPFIR